MFTIIKLKIQVYNYFNSNKINRKYKIIKINILNKVFFIYI